jgi:inner membrane protein
MDSLTHLLVGHAMGAVASGAGYGEAAYWAALIGNSIPDIDVPLSLIFRRDIKMHRTITHTVPGCVVLSVLTAVALHFFWPAVPIHMMFAWTLMGCFSHLVLDCLNLFGARPFWPLHGRSVDLALLHIWDPILMILLGIPALGVAMGRTSTALLALAFFLIWPYVLIRLVKARRLFRNLMAAGTLRARVIPLASSWRFVTETDTMFEFGHWQGGEPTVLERFLKLESPMVQASREDPQVASFLRTAEYPYASVEEDETGHWVVWGDVVRRLRSDFRPLRVRV